VAAIVVDFTDQVTLDTTPVLEGTCNQEFCDIEVTVDVNAVTGGPDDVFTTKGIGGQWSVATEPLVRPLYKPFVTSGGTPAENTYLDICMFGRLANGNLLAYFRRGSDHATNDGRIFCADSGDKGDTWSSERLVYDSPSGFDTRNQSGGVVASTGRVVIFYSDYDAVGVDRVDVGMISSTDDSQTFSGATSLLSEFPAAEQISGNVVPFGEMVETSNGLMQLFYYHGDSWALFSTDDGETFGNRVDVWTGSTPLNSIGEPRAVRIDNDRLVLIIRDNVNLNSYRYIKTDDGGATFSAISDPYPWTDTAMTAASPMGLYVMRGQVLGCITGRNPDWDVHTCRLGLEDFWERPYMLWSDQNVTRQDGLYSFTAPNSLDCGYSAITEIEGSPDTALISFYDDDGAVAETSIYMRLFPVV